MGQADDKAAQRARAEQLREQIERLKKGPDEKVAPAPGRSRSPREFIEEKMRELEERDRKAPD